MLTKRLKKNLTTDAIIVSGGLVPPIIPKDLVAGNNINLTPQGENEILISTTDELEVSGIVAKDGVSFDVSGEARFRDGIHTKQDVVLEDNENGYLTHLHQNNDGGFTIQSYDGDIVLITKTNTVSVNDLASLKAQVDALQNQLNLLTPNKGGN